MNSSSDFRVRVLGCGDAFASGGRFQSAFLLEIGLSRVLMECGATTLVALRQAGLEPDPVDLILISHLHGDHFGGLPFLLLDQQFRAKRTRPLVIAGPSGLADRLEHLLSILFPGIETASFGYPIVFKQLHPGQRARSIGPVKVCTFAATHPSGAPALAFRLEAHDRRLAFSGDTEWTDSLIGLAEATDLFICECHGYEAQTKHHMNYRTLTSRRDCLKTRRLMLTHLGSEMLARRAELDIEVLDDGALIEL